MNTLRTLYEIEPYDSSWLKVSDVHELYHEQCSNPQGKATLRLFPDAGHAATEAGIADALVKATDTFSER